MVVFFLVGLLFASVTFSILLELSYRKTIKRAMEVQFDRDGLLAENFRLQRAAEVALRHLETYGFESCDSEEVMESQEAAIRRLKDALPSMRPAGR